MKSTDVGTIQNGDILDNCNIHGILWSLQIATQCNTVSCGCHLFIITWNLRRMFYTGTNTDHILTSPHLYCLSGSHLLRNLKNYCRMLKIINFSGSSCTIDNSIIITCMLYWITNNLKFCINPGPLYKYCNATVQGWSLQPTDDFFIKQPACKIVSSYTTDYYRFINQSTQHENL